MAENGINSFEKDFISLYEEYFAYLVKYLISIVHDFDTAEDIAHDVFLRIYKNRIVTPSDRTGCRIYMTRSAKNMAIDYLRKQARDELKVKKCIPEWNGVIDQSFDVENIIIEGCIISTMSDVLSEFPERNREIFFERVLEEKSIRTVSSKSNLSRHKIKRIEKEILLRLKEKLRGYL